MNKIKALTKNFSDSAFLKNSIVFFFGSLFVAVLNYAYYPIMARFLSVSDFGEMQVIVTLILQSTIILNAFGYVVIHIFTNKKRETAQKDVTNLEGAALLIVTMISLLIIPFSKIISENLKFTSIWTVSIICLIFIINVFFTINNSWLQAKNKFLDVSVGAGISAFSKLSFSVIFIFLGFKILGILGALVVATLMSLLYVRLKSNTNIKISDHFFRNYFSEIIKNKDLQKDLYFGLKIFIIIISVTLLYSSDVIFVRYYFNEEIAGLFSGIASIARIVFFSTFAIATVLLPNIKIGEEKENIKNFLLAMILVLIIGTGFLGFVYLFPAFTINLLIGAKFLSYQKLLFPISLYILFASLLNTVSIYIIATKKKFLEILLVISIISLYLINYFQHQNVEVIVNNFIIINLLALIMSMFFIKPKNLLRKKSL